MEESIPKHVKDDERGTIKFSDFRPKNLHPKAKLRILIALLGTFLVIFGCIYMLSTSMFYFNPDLSTPTGLSEFLKNMVSILYIVGTILVIMILWYVMIKDCPISPAAKANYEASHDKSMKGVKVIAALAAAVANKGTGNSIDSVATAIDNYFDEPQDGEKNDKQSEHSSDKHGASV